MGQIEVRGFSPGDLCHVETLSTSIFAGDLVGERVITRDFILAPDFDADDLLIGSVGGRFAGFALLAGRSGDVWLVAFGVEPAVRHVGVGKALVAAAIARAERLGAERLRIGAVPTRYLVPGIDQASHGAAASLVTDHFGFVATGVVRSMIRPVDDVEPVADHDDISVLEDGDVGELRAFLLAEFNGTWWDYLASSLRAKLSGDSSRRVVLVARVDGNIVGTVQLANNRFGPLGVGAAARGRGVGRRLTEAALRIARRWGYGEIYFMIAEPEVVPFYTRLGFTERRAYTQFEKVL